MKTVILQNHQPDREFWNIMKGLGIFSVVVGHSWMWAQNFVYLYHVPLFFFISGYFYNEQKYGDRPWLNLHNRLHLWIKYIIVCIPFILLHNYFIRWHLVPLDTPYDSGTDMVIQMAYTVIGWNREFLAGVLWFVPTLVMASVFSGFTVTASRMAYVHTGKTVLKFILQAVIIISAGTAGYLMIQSGWQLPDKMQITLTVLPYMWLGYLLRNYMKEIEKWIRTEVALAFLLVLLWYGRNHLISLVDGYITPFMYVMSVMGFYVCMWLSGILRQYRPLRWIAAVFSDFGQASFWIMLVHFPIIRVIDLMYAVFVLHDVSRMYTNYLGTYPILVPVYLLCGVALPALLFKGLKRITAHRKAGLQI